MSEIEKIAELYAGYTARARAATIPELRTRSRELAQSILMEPDGTRSRLAEFDAMMAAVAGIDLELARRERIRADRRGRGGLRLVSTRRPAARRWHRDGSDNCLRSKRQ